MPQKWSKKIVIDHILKRHRRGQMLNSGYVQVHCKSLYMATYTHFGSWRCAIEAAGLSWDDVRVKVQKRKIVWSREIITQVIKKRYKKKIPLNSNYVQIHEARLYGAANKYFGGWPEAVEAAGLDYSKFRKVTMRYWSKEAIVAEILRRSNVGLSIRGYDVNNQDRGLYQAAKRHFGRNGWSKARVFAGFDPVDPRPWKIWNAETVKAEILKLYKNNVSLNAGALHRGQYVYVLAAGRKVFGSWGRAIRSAGLDYKKIRKGRQKGWWTKPRILMCIRALERRGVRLSHNSIRASRGPLLAATLVHFGSWSQAVEAAGIPYRLHTRVWSTKAWVRRMQEDEYTATLETAKTNARKRRRIA